MKHYLMTAAFIAATTATLATPALADTDVGVSINIGQPGYYGRIDIGDYGRPRVIYSEPRVVRRVAVNRAPIYLNVPPGHAKNWRKHCGKYDACGERVYFVQNTWYDREYVPRYQSRHRDRHDHDGRGDGRDDHRGNGDRGHDRDDHRGGDHRDNDRGDHRDGHRN